MADALRRRRAAGFTGSNAADKTPTPPESRSDPARPGKLWYALHFQNLRSLQKVSATDPLATIATAMQQFSDYISLVPPDSILFEVRSSLRYFQGLQRLQSQVTQSLLQQFPSPDGTPAIGQAISPSPSASHLLARNHQPQQQPPVIHQTDSLRSALGSLPVTQLPTSGKKIRQLQNSGLLYLRDIWRLPSAMLRKRLGSALVDYLERCLGQRAEPLPRWQAPACFHCHREADWPLEDQGRLLLLIEEMLVELTGFLQIRQLCTQHLLTRLHYEARHSTEFEILLRHPGRSGSHLLMLLATRLERMPLPAPVIAISMEATHFQAWHESARSPAGKQRNKGVLELLETLEARLGKDAIQSPGTREEYLPELASTNRNNDAATVATERLRPAWLLEAPEPLQICQGMPFYRSPLTLLSGPERIETGWWRGPDIRRDYYIACNEHGQQLWVFRGLSEAGDQGRLHWYLHGFFA